VTDFKEITNALRALENIYGCQFCLHDYTRQLVECRDLPRYHLNPFCTIKFRLRQYISPCCAFDINDVQKQLTVQPGGFWKRCAFGLIELVTPIILHGQPIGVLFSGPFREGDPLPGPVLSAAKMIRSDAFKNARQKLPVWTAAIGQTLPPLVQLVARQLAVAASPVTIAETPAAPIAPEGGRRNQIDHFLSRRFRENVSLEQLAEFLDLSVSRTAQLVKEYFKVSYVELLTAYRLEQAMELLRHSGFTVEQVADYTGFRSGTYFHRVFRRATGQTPAAWRRLNRHNPEIEAKTYKLSPI